MRLISEQFLVLVWAAVSKGKPMAMKVKYNQFLRVYLHGNAFVIFKRIDGIRL